MTAFIIRRFFQGIILILIVSVLIFSVMQALPGDPLLLFFSDTEIGEFTDAELHAMRAEHNLDKPIPVQYLLWITGVLQGDFGTSIHYKESVGILLIERLPVTMYLGLLAVIFSAIFGMFAGIISAIRWSKWQDSILTTLANVGITTPSFWLGILLIYLFGFKLGWLSMSGFTSPITDFWLSIKQTILPVICLSIFPLASTARQTRSSMLEVVRQDYVRTAWSKGLMERRVILKHALKNALIPVVTLMGTRVRVIFGGSVLIETVFNIPGMGRLMASAVFGRDFQVVQTGVLVIATVIIFTNLLVDISYSWLDPRIRYD